MSVVSAEIEVNKNPSSVFEIAKEVDKYPEFMPDIESINVIERRDDGYARVSWKAHVKVASIDKPVKWIEDEWWNTENLSSRFELVEGDYKHYFGDWEFTETSDGTRVKLTVDYDLGLPLVGPLINKLLDKLVQENLKGMLLAIKQKAEGVI